MRRKFSRVIACFVQFTFVSLVAFWGMPADAAPLDVSSCPTQDGQCVTVLKNIESIKLMHAGEQLSFELQRAKLDGYAAAQAHRQSVFRAQYIASWIILVLVISIVSVGLIMSWRQMVHGLNGGAVRENTVEFGIAGIKVQSAVIGLIVFLASIVFFSIYIDKVYTITIFKEAEESLEKSSKK